MFVQRRYQTIGFIITWSPDFKLQLQLLTGICFSVGVSILVLLLKFSNSLIFSNKNTSFADDPYHPYIVKEHFKIINFKTVNAAHNALKERFEQPSFIIFSNVEQLPLTSINSESYQK